MAVGKHVGYFNKWLMWEGPADGGWWRPLTAGPGCCKKAGLSKPYGESQE